MSLAPDTSLMEARALLEARVLNTWTALGRDPAFIQWPNTDFTMPKRGVWMRVDFQWMPSLIATICGDDAGLQQQHGLMFVTVFGARNRGAAELLTICDAFLASLERKNVGEVFIDTVDGPVELGDEAWASQQLTFDYYIFRQMAPCTL